MHAHGTLLFDQKPLVNTVYVEVVTARSQHLDWILRCEDFLADYAELLANCCASPARIRPSRERWC